MRKETKRGKVVVTLTKPQLQAVLEAVEDVVSEGRNVTQSRINLLCRALHSIAESGKPQES